MEKSARLYGMKFDIWHDKPLKPGGLKTSPGGYEITFKDGRKFAFDFIYSRGEIDAHNPHIAHYYVYGLDTYAFPNSIALTRDALGDDHYNDDRYMFTEFYIDTEGYDDEHIWVLPLYNTVSFVFDDE